MSTKPRLRSITHLDQAALERARKAIAQQLIWAHALNQEQTALLRSSARSEDILA